MNPIAGKPIGCAALALALILAACFAWAPAGLAQTEREQTLTKKDAAETEFQGSRYRILQL